MNSTSLPNILGIKFSKFEIDQMQSQGLVSPYSHHNFEGQLFTAIQYIKHLRLKGYSELTS
jgi:hypothetical protein